MPRTSTDDWHTPHELGIRTLAPVILLGRRAQRLGKVNLLPGASPSLSPMLANIKFGMKTIQMEAYGERTPLKQAMSQEIAWGVRERGPRIAAIFVRVKRRQPEAGGGGAKVVCGKKVGLRWRWRPGAMRAASR